MNDLFNILSNSNKDIDNQKIMDYLAGKLSGDDKHEVEKWMNENPFLNEAMEGLQSVKEPEQVSAYIQQLNTQLSKQLSKKPKRRTYKVQIDLTYAIIAILIILTLAVLAFLVIHGMKSK
jgi:ABC-type bacteriocin/lantibiotic exporter with double-glycine peptidase domain